MKKLLLLLSSILILVPAEAQIVKNRTPSGMPMGQPVSTAEIPANYEFDWKYTARVTTSEGEMDIIYRLKKNAPYMGMEMQQTDNVLMVVDNQKDLMVMFMDAQGAKMLMATKFDPKTTVEDEDFYKNAQVREIENKTILGYPCQGYEVESEKYKMRFWVTDKPEVSFTKMFLYGKTKLPAGINEKWLKAGNGLILEMDMTDKSNSKNNANMIATDLQQERFTVKKANYRSMYGN